jgi:hypothetical protein
MPPWMAIVVTVETSGPAVPLPHAETAAMVATTENAFMGNAETSTDRANRTPFEGGVTCEASLSMPALREVLRKSSKSA